MLMKLLPTLFFVLLLACPAMAVSVTPATFQYDANDRLLQVNYGDGKQVNYTYDDMGNITSIKTRNASPPVVTIGSAIQGTVGVAITDYPIPVNTTTGVLGYAATGLPGGLKVNAGIVVNADGKLPGTIYGKPTVGGVFKTTVTARNITGTSTPAQLIIIIANPFTEVVDGFKLSASASNISGIIETSSIVGGELGGEISLKVATTGAFTGTLKLGAKSYPIAGQFNPLTGVANAITIVRAGIGNLTLHLALDLSGTARGIVTGTLDDASMHSADVDAAANPWSTTHKATIFSGTTSARYNVALPLNPLDVGTATIPQGAGYCSIVVGTTGVATIAGVLADGTSFTKSPIVWEDGTVPINVLLYSSKGYLKGTVVLDSGLDVLATADNTAAGTLAWSRPAITGQVYPLGFNTGLDAVGGAYVAPATGYRMFDLGNAASHVAINLTLSKAWLVGDIVTALTISSANAVTTFTPNSYTHSLTLTKTTGNFSGKFVVPTPTRTVSYKGIIIPAIGTSTSRGYGFFMMPQTTTTSSQLSGKAVIARP